MTIRTTRRTGGMCRGALALVCALAAAPVLAEEQPAAVEGTAADGSYGIGFGMGRNLADQQIEGLDIEALQRGLRDGAAGKEPALTPEQLQAGIQVLQMATMAKQQEAQAAAVAASDAFLANNASREGVVVLDSGLQYEVLAEGSGASPDVNDTVTTHYHGTFIDGTVFDSSVDRGQPATFAVNGVISGWTEALQLMQVGDKWRLFVPSNLAYGERGAGGGRIPPNSALVFEVELLGIEAAADADSDS